MKRKGSCKSDNNAEAHNLFFEDNIPTFAEAQKNPALVPAIDAILVKAGRVISQATARNAARRADKVANDAKYDKPSQAAVAAAAKAVSEINWLDVGTVTRGSGFSQTKLDKALGKLIVLVKAGAVDKAVAKNIQGLMLDDKTAEAIEGLKKAHASIAEIFAPKAEKAEVVAK